MRELVDEARLAHARLANDRRDLTMTVGRQLLRTAELFQLGVAADEARQPAPRGRLQSGPRRARPRHLVDLHGVGEPLHRHKAQRRDCNEAFHELQGGGRQQNAARARELLHSSRQMRRLAYGRVVHVEIAANGAHDDLARVKPDPDLHVHAVRVARLLRVALHPLLHPERRIARPHGVVLVSEWCTKQRHDPIAHDLVDGALVTMNRLHHVLEDGVEQLAGFLRVAVCEQFHRALEVGEEDCDLLTLAFQGGLGDQDLLGEVLGRVGLGRGEAASVSDY